MEEIGEFKKGMDVVNMKQLREYIEQWLDGKKVKGIKVTPCDIQECVIIYNAMVRKEKPEFINGKIKKILDRCEIETVEVGIGWKVA